MPCKSVLSTRKNETWRRWELVLLVLVNKKQALVPKLERPSKPSWTRTQNTQNQQTQCVPTSDDSNSIIQHYIHNTPGTQHNKYSYNHRRSERGNLWKNPCNLRQCRLSAGWLAGWSVWLECGETISQCKFPSVAGADDDDDVDRGTW